MRSSNVAVVFRLDAASVIFLDAAAFFHPGGAMPCEAGIDVDRDIRIGVGAGGVIDRQVRLAGIFGEHDLAKRHAQIGAPHPAFAKILREEGNGPVVTAVRVVSGLERMFMWSPY